MAFRDIHPAANEHLLVISKCHIPSLFDLRGTQDDLQLGAGVHAR